MTYCCNHIKKTYELIKNCQNNIETIRQSLLGGDIDTDDLQEIAERCEKVAELRLELEQQLETRIEIPPR